MKNYFNTLSFREKLMALQVCEFLDPQEFDDGINILKDKKIVIVGCNVEGLNHGLNLRDSGLEISFALSENEITNKEKSYQSATENNFAVGTYEELIPIADFICNLTPQKQHTALINTIMPMMKKETTLLYSNGFNIIEEGMEIREDITVILVSPKSPFSEIREEYKRRFGVPTSVAIHIKNDPLDKGFDQMKAYAVALGSHRAGVALSSFTAEAKINLIGEQTLFGLLQTASVLCFDKMIEKEIDAAYAKKLIQQGWEVITEALKHGGITNMMNRLCNPAKIEAFMLAEELKYTMRPLFQKHMDDIISGEFSKNIIEDWKNADANLLKWHKEIKESTFEKTEAASEPISEQEYFNHGTLMVAFLKVGVELAFETMTETGIVEESAYYKCLHETALVANVIAKKGFSEMNKVIPNTARYGGYVFYNACKPLLEDFMENIDSNVMGKSFSTNNTVDNKTLIGVNEEIYNHPIEEIGLWLRGYMKGMKSMKGIII